jgi:hypothetical protein
MAEEFEIVKMACINCHKEVERPSQFRTGESLRRYMITGWCQNCQDMGDRKEELKKLHKDAIDKYQRKTPTWRQNDGDRFQAVLEATILYYETKLAEK